MRTDCPVCAAQNISEDGVYRNGGPHANPAFDGLSVRICGACGTGWAENAPTDEQLGEYYSKVYNPARMKGLKADVWPQWDNRAASLLALGRIFGQFKEGDLFVDVGPGNGAALGLANWMLPSPRLACVEFNEASITYFKRHMPEITVTQSLQAFGPGAASMIYSSHSLEHFLPNSLSDEIRSVFNALRPGGVFVLEVPLEKASNSKAHTPHLTFFSVNGTKALLERAGFDVGLTLLAEGRLKASARRVAARYRQDFPRSLAAARVLTMGDLVPSSNPGVGAIKCIAIRPDVPQT